MWQKEGRNRELWNSMESHGRLKEKKLYIYIHYLVTKQAKFLASDFSVLVCFVCLVFFRFTNRLVFWRIVLLFISYSHHYNSQHVFFGCLLITTYLWDQVKEKIQDIFFPEQSGDPLTRNWTRQPEVLLFALPQTPYRHHIMTLHWAPNPKSGVQDSTRVRITVSWALILCWLSGEYCPILSSQVFRLWPILSTWSIWMVTVVAEKSAMCNFGFSSAIKESGGA